MVAVEVVSNRLELLGGRHCGRGLKFEAVMLIAMVVAVVVIV